MVSDAHDGGLRGKHMTPDIILHLEKLEESTLAHVEQLRAIRLALTEHIQGPRDVVLPESNGDYILPANPMALTRP